MKKKEILKRVRKFTKPFRVTDGKEFKLKHIDPEDTLDLKSEDKPRAQEALQNGIELLAELQDKLYAQDRWSVLLIFQAMDAAGKDGAIKHVMSGINPQGCQVYSFKHQPVKILIMIICGDVSNACLRGEESEFSTEATTRKLLL